jgi:two-component system response regulator GlrR
LALHFRKQILKQKGYRVLTAATGKEGLDLFAAETVRAVVLDYKLDGWEGPLVAGQMRRQRANVPIIMLSEEAGLPEGARAVVDVVISESSGRDSLTRALEGVLQGKNRHHLSTDAAPPA